MGTDFCAFIHDFHNVHNCLTFHDSHTANKELSALASAMFAPGVPQLMGEFGSKNTVLASLVVSIYILGNAFGPILLAPLSGIHTIKNISL